MKAAYAKKILLPGELIPSRNLKQPTAPRSLDTAIDDARLHSRRRHPFPRENLHLSKSVGFSTFTYVSAPGRRVKRILCNLIQCYVPVLSGNAKHHLKRRMWLSRFEVKYSGSTNQMILCNEGPVLVQRPHDLLSSSHLPSSSFQTLELT